MDHNECLRRYALRVVTITWNRDSHGLFDFETRQLAREYFETTASKSFVRVDQNCKLLDPAVSVRDEYARRGQLLMQILCNRNKYILQTPMVYKIRNARTHTEVKQIYERDMENFYGDLGEQLLEPYDMTERMYLVIKSILNRNVKQEYEIKKHDIIKLGRVKFQVKGFNIIKNKKAVKRKNKRIARHRQGFADRFI